MKTQFNALKAGFVLAALIPFSAAFAADTPTPAPETPLHEIGSDATVSPTPTPTPTPTLTVHHVHDDDNDRVRFNDSTYVGPNEVIDDNAVAINGRLTVDGVVNGNGVAVLGPVVINGTVHGNAVAVMGNLTLGPNARVDGNAVSVGGRVNVVPVNFGADLSENTEASSFWTHGLRKGRPMAFGPHLHFFWIAQLCLVAFYLLLALIFPNGVKKCGDTLQNRPGITFLTGFLVVLGLPVLFILLCVTVVGIPVAFVVVPLSVIACIMFGKVALYSLIGRSIIRQPAHVVATVIVGILVASVFYFIPIMGLMVWFLVSFVGFSCAITTLFTGGKAPPAAGLPPVAAAVAPAAPAAPLAVPAAVAIVSPVAGAPESPVVPPPLQAPVVDPSPPVIPAAAALVPPSLHLASDVNLPRAGFWIRMVALLIDAILVGIVTQMSGMFLPALALYGALLWKFRGATVGGIIFGLKVVRLDGQPFDWVTVSVRALACFFSLIVVGLGFIWIAFDGQKQGWHDKIAGTVVVRMPKGVSLV